MEFTEESKAVFQEISLEDVASSEEQETYEINEAVYDSNIILFNYGYNSIGNPEYDVRLGK